MPARYGDDQARKLGDNVTTTDIAVVPFARTRSRRRRVVAAASAAVVVALITAWLVVGLTPRLSDGSISAPDPEALTEPFGFVFGPDEQVVSDPSDGSLDGEWSFRNDGPVTIVVTAPPQDVGGVSYKVHLRLIPPNGGSSLADADVVTVDPGEEFGVAYSWAPGCAPMSAGTAVGTDTVRLHVSTLGLSRTLDVHTNQPLVYSTQVGHTPPASCSS